MRIVTGVTGSIAASALALALGACSSNSTIGGGTGGQDPGLTNGGSGVVQAPDVNPNGVPYPTTNLGTTALKLNGTKIVARGNRIQNYKFLGYPGGDMTKGLQPVALADYFDPDGKLGFKLIHIQAAGVWCYWCQQEAKALTSLATGLPGQGVVWLTAVAEGTTQGAPSTQADLNSWVKLFNLPITQMLDSGDKNLGVFYNQDGLPWNSYVDPRSMEVLYSNTGAPSADGQTVTPTDVQGEITTWLNFVGANAAEQ